MTINKNLKKGFTLIELLIVIAILGVLAVVVLVAINPLEQLARTRDAGRISSVTQLGHAVQAYYTSQSAVYPPEATWNTALTGSGELTTVPSAIAYSVAGVSACTENVINNWCYDLDATNGAILYARLESNSNVARCATGQIAWVVYSSADGRGGVVCTAAAATGLDPLAAGGFTYM
jgi:prepilin-type N-terminal cleavage/methylation domain-containing protein